MPETFQTVTKSRYTDIQADILEDCQKIWAVKAKLADENSEEIIISYIDDLTGRIIYTDPYAKTDPFAKTVIQDILDNIAEHPVSIGISPYGAISLKMKSKRGIFEASAEPGCELGTDVDTMFISAQLSEEPYVFSDLVATKTDGKDINIYLWSNIFDEDYQGEPTTINGDDIRELIEREKK